MQTSVHHRIALLCVSVAACGSDPDPADGGLPDAANVACEDPAPDAQFWSRRVGAPTPGITRVLNGVAVDRGGTIAVAYMETPPEFVEPSCRATAAAYDRQGRHLWSRALEGPDGVGSAGNVAATPNGFAVVGTFDGSVRFGDNEDSELTSRDRGTFDQPGGDAFVATYGLDGDYQWAVRLGDNLWDVGMSVAADENGNVTSATYWNVDGSFVGEGDALVGRHAAEGIELWTIPLSRVFLYPGGRIIAVDATGATIIVGMFGALGPADLGGGELPTYGGRDIFLAKYDASGDHLWSRAVGGPDTDTARGVAVDSDDNIVVVGGFEGTAVFGDGAMVAAGEFDIFVAKYASDGNHLWSVRFGAAGFDVADAVAVGDDGSIVVSGSFQNSVDFGGGEHTAVGYADVVLLELDSAGGYRWSRSYDDVSATGLGIDDDGAIVVAGTFSADINFGFGSISPQGEQEIFVARLPSPPPTAP